MSSYSVLKVTREKALEAFLKDLINLDEIPDQFLISFLEKKYENQKYLFEMTDIQKYNDNQLI